MGGLALPRVPRGWDSRFPPRKVLPVKGVRFPLPWLVLGAAPAGLALWCLGAEVFRPNDLLFAAAIPLAVAILVAWIPARSPRRLPVALPLVLFSLGWLATTLVLEAPQTNDEAAYLLQADLFASARLAEPIVQPGCPEGVAHCPTHRRQIYEDSVAGVRFAKYPPGTSLALMPFQWLGIPSVAGLLAGLASLLLLAKLAELLQTGDRGRGVLLLAVAPFFLLVQGSFQSEAFTLPAALAGWLCLLRWRREGVAAAGVGIAAGWIFLCRPLTGVIFALSALPGLLSARNRASKGSGLFAAILGGLPFLAILLLYQKAQTGYFLVSQYELYAQRFGPWDSTGSPLDVYGRGDFWTGLLRQAGRWSITLWGTLGAVGLGLAGLIRMRRKDGGFALLFAILLPTGYALHWYSGHRGYLGPLYAYETLGGLSLGAAILLSKMGPRWGRGLVAGAFVSSLVLFVHRLDYASEVSDLRMAPWHAAEARDTLPANAVILLPSGPGAGKWLLPSHSPFEKQEWVFLRTYATNAETLAMLEAMHLAERPRYRFVPGAALVPGANRSKDQLLADS